MALFETIKYELINKEGHIEIRKYKNIFLASTKTIKTSSQDSGFNNVFQYISGTNDQETKISMTTPVVTYEEDNQLVTGFYVPSKYTKDNIPKPTNDKVFINELKESHYAVIKFHGKWTDNNFEKHNQLLLNYIGTKGYQILSHKLILRYQPPFVPGLLRRNEIAYQINYPIETS